MKKLIYLDNAATTYPKPECVYKTMEEANRCLAVNAGRGSYHVAKKASSIIERAREHVLAVAEAEEVAEVVFTPSATLACNQVLGGLEWKKEDVVYVTPYEHNAVMRVLYLLQEQYGFRIEELAIEPETLWLDIEKIKYQFSRKPPGVVIMSQVSNVTGYMIPWQDIAAEAKEYQAVVVIDGSQGLGLVPTGLKNTSADFYIFAGHKTLYGPLGIGGYINNRGIKLRHVLAGGTGSDSLNLKMPDDIAGYEPGSHNIVAIAGLLAAMEEVLTRNQQKEKLKAEQELRQYLEDKLQKIPGVILYAADGEKKFENQKAVTQRTGITAMNMEGYQAADVGMILDEDYNIAVRTGYHCAPLIHKYLRDKDYSGVVRISIGRFNTKEEVEDFIKAVEEIAAGW